MIRAASARGMHPPFSFRSCRKENGPCTIQKKRTLSAELAHKAQVRLNTGAVLADCHQFSSLLPARAILVPRIGVPRVYTAAVVAGGYRKARPPGPADATMERQRKEKQRVSGRSKPPHNPRRAGLFLRIGFPRVCTAAVVAGGYRKARPPGPADATLERQRKEKQGAVRVLQTPARTTPRAETFLEPDKQSHRAAFFSLGPCTARSLFGKTKKRMGGAFPPAKPAQSPRRVGAPPVPFFKKERREEWLFPPARLRLLISPQRTSRS